MVVVDWKMMEASACNSRNGWRSNPLSLYGRVDSVNDTWVNRTPVIVPCYNGRSLQIHEGLVVNGLSAISIKHHKGNCSEVASAVVSDICKDKNEEEELKRTFKLKSGVKNHSTMELPVCLGDRMKRRNSFWNMHRPELSKLTWPQNYISSAMLQDFFHHHLRTHGTFCEPLHADSNGASVNDDELRDYTILRELVPPTVLPPDEKAMGIVERSRSVRLNDEDLDPEIKVHKSRAEFCVTVGEHMKKTLKRSTSHQIPKTGVQSSGRLEALTVQRDGFFSKEGVSFEEVVSSVLSNTEPSAQYIETPRTKPPENNVIQGTMRDHVIEDSGDPACLRTILSPREEGDGAAEGN